MTSFGIYGGYDTNSGETRYFIPDANGLRVTNDAAKCIAYLDTRLANGEFDAQDAEGKYLVFYRDEVVGVSNGIIPTFEYADEWD